MPLEIVDLLLADDAMVNVFDPKADFSELVGKPKFNVCLTVTDALTKADIAILLTEWKEFKTIDWDKEKTVMSQATIFDTKNFLDGNHLKAIGYKYYSVGR